MTTTFDAGGLWVPIVTPFDESGAVDVDALARLAARLLSDGADGLVALGTTGEPATLTGDERRRVVEVCAASCTAHGRWLMVGCGTNATATTLAEVRAWSATDGVDALLVVSPYYTRPSEEAIVEHLRAAAAASAVPVVVYNIPYRTGRGLGAASLLELASVPNVAGVKQAVGALDHDTLALLADAPAGFAVLAGDDAFAAPIVLAGGSGAIAAAAHLRTPDWVRLVAAARAGDAPAARPLATSLLPLVDAGFAEPSPAGWKAALHALGEIATPTVRRPLTEASSDATARLIDLLGLTRR